MIKDSSLWRINRIDFFFFFKYCFPDCRSLSILNSELHSWSPAPHAFFFIKELFWQHGVIKVEVFLYLPRDGNLKRVIGNSNIKQDDSFHDGLDWLSGVGGLDVFDIPCNMPRFCSRVQRQQWCQFPHFVINTLRDRREGVSFCSLFNIKIWPKSFFPLLAALLESDVTKQQVSHSVPKQILLDNAPACSYASGYPKSLDQLVNLLIIKVA